MIRLIVIIIILALGWCFYTGKIDLNNLKEDAIEKLQNEKTVKTINSSRERTQYDVDKIRNGEYR